MSLSTRKKCHVCLPFASPARFIRCYEHSRYEMFIVMTRCRVCVVVESLERKWTRIFGFALISNCAVISDEHSRLTLSSIPTLPIHRKVKWYTTQRYVIMVFFFRHEISRKIQTISLTRARDTIWQRGKKKKREWKTRSNTHNSIYLL